MADHKQRRSGQKNNSEPLPSNSKTEQNNIPTGEPSNATIGKPINTIVSDMGRYPGRGFRPQNVW